MVRKGKLSACLVLFFVALLCGGAEPSHATNPTASYTCTSTSSTVLANVNGFRKGFQWQNTGSVNAIIAIATNNACTGSPPNGYVLPPGDVYKLPDGSEPVPTSDIACCTVTGTTTAVGQEW